MTAPDSANKSHQRDLDDPLNDRLHRTSFVWPLVATFMAALAVRHMLSLKRRLLKFDGFAQQDNGTRQQNGFRNPYDTSWTNGRGAFHEREGSAQREKERSDDPWSRHWKDRFADIEELERLERIRRMQDVFHRERTVFTRKNVKWYETWQEDGRTGEKVEQEAGREDWYWGRADWEAWRADRGRFESSQVARKSPQAHHYDVLGLDSSKVGMYSEDEIKVFKLPSEPRLCNIILIETSIEKILQRENLERCFYLMKR